MEERTFQTGTCRRHGVFGHAGACFLQAGHPPVRQLVPKKTVTGLVSKFKNLEMICYAGTDTVLYDFPSTILWKDRQTRTAGTFQYRVGQTGRCILLYGMPHSHYKSVKGCTVYACVMVAYPEKPTGNPLPARSKDPYEHNNLWFGANHRNHKKGLFRSLCANMVIYKKS